VAACADGVVQLEPPPTRPGPAEAAV
jgi:hypothetical protein